MDLKRNTAVFKINGRFPVEEVYKSHQPESPHQRQLLRLGGHIEALIFKNIRPTHKTFHSLILSIQNNEGIQNFT